MRWLQDVDYNPNCELCDKKLADDDCIRLICYHVFHWACLDSYARKMPVITAPAGYTCPSCNEAIFPEPNLVSPIADALKEKISTVNWARCGLGLPLLSEDTEVKPVSSHSSPSSSVFSDATHMDHLDNKLNNVDTVVNVDETIFTRPEMSGNQGSRRTIYGADKLPLIQEDYDEDKSKYRRRALSQWLNKWSLWRKIRVRHCGRCRPKCFIITLAIVLFLLLMVSMIGRITTSESPAVEKAQMPDNVNPFVWLTT